MNVDAADVAVTVDVDAASDLRDAALHQKSDELATNFEVDILQKIGAANLQKMMAGVTDVSMRTQLTETLNSMEFVNNLGFTAEQTASLAAHDAVVLQNRHESLRPMLQDIFRKYDVDGNMKISKEEYKTLFPEVADAFMSNFQTYWKKYRNFCLECEAGGIVAGGKQSSEWKLTLPDVLQCSCGFEIDFIKPEMDIFWPLVLENIKTRWPEFIEETFNIMDADQSGDLDEGEFLSKFMVFMDNLCGKLQTGAETVVADVRKLKNKEFLACLQNANTAKGGNLQRSGGGSCCVVC